VGWGLVAQGGVSMYAHSQDTRCSMRRGVKGALSPTEAKARLPAGPIN
jgi:hypothetical protein